MQLTYFGSNSWLLELADRRILVDPWLVGSLVFGNLTWLFKGDRAREITPPPADIDLILLSQGLEDHAHKPTLAVLDKQIPVVGSPSAAKVAEDLGYQQVSALVRGETFTLGDRVEIRALPGAPVGLQKENAYLLKSLSNGQSIYYEPHGFPPEEVKEYAPVDVVINPMVNLELPLAGAIIEGQKSSLRLAKWLQPKVMFPTAAGGDVQFSGVLLSLLKAVGGVESVRSQLASEGLKTEVVELTPERPYALGN